MLVCATTDGGQSVRFMGDPGLIKLPLPPARFTTSEGVAWGSSCSKNNPDILSVFVRRVQLDVDDSRAADAVC